MLPKFTLRQVNGPVLHNFPTLRDALAYWHEFKNGWPSRIYVEVPNRAPYLVQGFTGAGIPLIEYRGALVPLY